MNRVVGSLREWLQSVVGMWDRFWFTPMDPHVLAIVRVTAGAMLFYTHLVWFWDFDAFLGSDSWVPTALSRQLHQGVNSWSYVWQFESTAVLKMLHVAGLVVFFLLTIGLWTRAASILAWLITLSYCHRMSEVFFGLDQVNCMLAMYLMLGPSGAVYSVDRWRAVRAGQGGAVQAQVSANVAIRLLQLHMCIIYLFGGISKMRGQMWWDGSAVWFAVANLEYQSLDITWLVHYPLVIAALSHATVFWEASYCVFVWHRLTRPIVLLMAFCVHGGIALFLGMITFGLAMLIGNLAFLRPETVQHTVDAVVRLVTRSSDRSVDAPGRADEH